MGKMIFPDGTIKEGQFENNAFKGPLSNSNESVVVSGGG